MPAHFPAAIVALGALSIPCAVCGAIKDAYCFPGTHGFCRSRWEKSRLVMFAATYEASLDAKPGVLATRRYALLMECPRCSTARGAYCHPWKHSFCRERWEAAVQQYRMTLQEGSVSA